MYLYNICVYINMHRACVCAVGLNAYRLSEDVGQNHNYILRTSRFTVNEPYFVK